MLWMQLCSSQLASLDGDDKEPGHSQAGLTPETVRPSQLAEALGNRSQLPYAVGECRRSASPVPTPEAA